MTAPVLGYQDFFKEFILGMDALLEGLEATLSLQGDDGKPQS